jgi:hypothetical protein
MLKSLLCCILAAVICAGCYCVKSDKCCAMSKAECQKVCMKECPKVLRYVIMFKFKEGTTPEQIDEVNKAFASLPGKISEIKCFEGGANISPDKRNEGFSHCFLLTFRSETDRDAYLAHPDFKVFGKLLWTYLDKVLVIDYWTK